MNSSSSESIALLPLLTMILGVLAIGAAVLGEFDGPRPPGGASGLLLAVLGVALLVGGALMLRS